MSDDPSLSEVHGLIAIGLAHDFWRGQWATVEESHIHRPPHRLRRISDGEMFAANVKVTRIMLQEVRVGVDLERIVEVLASPDCIRVGRWADASMEYRNVSDLLGPYYAQWLEDVRERAQWISTKMSEDGLVETLSMYAYFASTVASHWWSGPGWRSKANALLAQTSELPPGLPVGLRDRDTVRRMLVESPDVLGTEALEWLVCQGLG